MAHYDHNGDFNYDGVVNADYYFLIDSAFIGQSRTLTASNLTSTMSTDTVAVSEATGTKGRAAERQARCEIEKTSAIFKLL
ncbi:MAG: hypothetical protein NTU53_17970 [Planctomycetota bacterium]|nr:hypothetical protein [Planctomycetota bacterium]